MISQERNLSFLRTPKKGLTELFRRVPVGDFYSMFRLYKYRIYPTKRQKREIFRQFDIHKNLYNFCLEERKTAYEKEKKNISCFEQNKINIPKFKNNCNTSSLQATNRRLEKAFQAFFRRVKQGQTPGYPRFKKKFNSITFRKSDGASIRNGKLRIQHIGLIKTVFHLPVPDYTEVTIKYHLGQFFVFFVVELPENPITTDKTKQIGLDFGLQTFVTTSNGDKIDSPKFLKQSLKRLSKASSKRDKCEKGSLERKKKAKVVQHIYRKVTNQRLDFNHKLSRKLVDEYKTICLEKLDIQGMKGNIAAINRTYDDVSWAQLTQMLDYKAESAGCQVVYVEPSYTSQTCYCCGKRQELSLKEREYSCSCGYRENRDVNAAKNILALGLQSLVQT